MRLSRRVLVAGLLVSFVASLALVIAAAMHDPAKEAADHATSRDGGHGAASQARTGFAVHNAMEVGLWVGALAASAFFVAAVVGFRREVSLEKGRMRRARDRRRLMQELRNYRRARQGGQPPNT